MTTRFAGGSCSAVPSAALVCAQCPAVACGLCAGGLWWQLVALWRCAVLVALSLLPVNNPKIDFKADSRRLLSHGNTRVAGNIKNALKVLILKCKHSLRKHCQKNTDFQAGVFSVVFADQGM